jgi:hypothetical protein
MLQMHSLSPETTVQSNPNVLPSIGVQYLAGFTVGNLSRLNPRTLFFENKCQSGPLMSRKPETKRLACFREELRQFRKLALAKKQQLDKLSNHFSEDAKKFRGIN